MKKAVQIATRTAGGVVSIAPVRNLVDGGTTYAVSYSSRATYWLSRHKFEEPAQAEDGARTLAEFLGAELRL